MFAFSFGLFQGALNSPRLSPGKQRTLKLPRTVLDRYSISDMTLWRWLHDLRMAFPAPLYFERFSYWRLSELVTWEAQRAHTGGRSVSTARRHGWQSILSIWRP